jgi:hypothetical protein
MKLPIMLSLILFLSGCDIFSEQETQFARNHFHSAVAHIELHKIRNGTYPTDLGEIEFLNELDGLWLNSVDYKKVGDGYNLYIAKGVLQKTNFTLPDSFFNGLGLKDTNVSGDKT